MSQIHEINAILEDDLTHFLDHYGLLQKITRGEVKCCNCDQIIHLESIAAIHLKEGKVFLKCDSDLCEIINTDL